MTFDLETLRQSPCQNDLLLAGALVRGVLVVPDHLAAPILAKCAQPPAAQPVIVPPNTFASKLLPVDAQAKRLAACEVCEKNVTGNCSICQTCGGRPVKHKVRLSSESCPLMKW